MLLLPKHDALNDVVLLLVVLEGEGASVVHLWALCVLLATSLMISALINAL